MSEQSEYRTLIAGLMRYEPRTGYQQPSDIELDPAQRETIVAANPDVLKGVRPDPKRLQVAMAAQGRDRERLLASAVEHAIAIAARQFVFNDVQERIAAQQEHIVATSVSSERAAANDAGMAYGVPA